MFVLLFFFVRRRFRSFAAFRLLETLRLRFSLPPLRLRPLRRLRRPHRRPFRLPSPASISFPEATQKTSETTDERF